MAVPARGSAAAQDPAPARKPDPKAPGWADVRRAMIADAHTAALVAGELARVPGNGAALAMARLLATALQSLGVIAGDLLDAERKRAFDEKAVEAVRRESFDEGFAAGQALRGRLSLVSDSG